MLCQQALVIVGVTSLSTGCNSGASYPQKTKLLATVPDAGREYRSCNGSPGWVQTAIETAATAADCNNRSMLPQNIRTRFFLVNTKHPGNVGSSARSLKTMGFFPEGLVVVDPHDKRVLGRKKCIDASSGAKDVLEESLLVVCDEEEMKGDILGESGLSKALQQAFGEEDVLVCGTGMPVDMSQSRASRVYLEPRQFFQKLLGEYHKSRSNHQTETDTQNLSLNVAFVFGNERYGMAQEDLDLCDVVLGIPTHPSFGSLNLATAVQIIAYDWRQALGGYYD